MRTRLTLSTASNNHVCLTDTTWGWILSIVDTDVEPREARTAILTPQNVIDLHEALGEILGEKT